MRLRHEFFNLMHVRDALTVRYSCRAYLNRPVCRNDLRDIIEKAGQAPSGGNLQPWQVHAVSGSARQRVIDAVREAQNQHPFGEPELEYQIYPSALADPWRARRRTCAETFYGALGIARDDKTARLLQIAKNFEFFGAPAGLFLVIHKSMQPGQWADLGMFAQSFMLAATEAGLASCAQESWALFPRAVKTALDIGDDYTLFCGIAVGYPDKAAPVNQARPGRTALEDFVTFEGF